MAERYGRTAVLDRAIGWCSQNAAVARSIWWSAATPAERGGCAAVRRNKAVAILI
jgi:hypothetical protein